MNREIKFKSYLKESSGKITAYIWEPFGDANINSEVQDLVEPGIELLAYGLQYTGLKDRHGKEIYEGDICKAYQTLYTIPSPLIVKVIYNNDYARFEPVQYWKGDNKWKSLSDGFKCNYTFEIIGNLFEHPELLKQ